jgi:HAD superfamily hydrolase (TIGR01509 family)
MKPELVIFDCDGVLVDSEPIAARVFAGLLCEVGLPTTAEQADQRYRGRSMKSCLELVRQELGSLPDAFEADLQERTFAEFRSALMPVAGVEGVLRGLAVPFCVASSGSHAKMKLTLGLTGLLRWFEGKLFSATEVARGKPFPDLFLHAAERMGVDPARSVVVEDSAVGVRAARAAGMEVLGYASDRDPGSLAAAGARVFRRMAELPSLLHGMELQG